MAAKLITVNNNEQIKKNRSLYTRDIEVYTHVYYLIFCEIVVCILFSVRCHMNLSIIYKIEHEMRDITDICKML